MRVCVSYFYMPSRFVSSVRDAYISNDCGTAEAALEDTKTLPGILKFSPMLNSFVCRKTCLVHSEKSAS